MRSFASSCVGLLLLAGTGFLQIAESYAATALRLIYDRPVDGTFAPLLLAESKGFFRDQGLAVTTNVAKGPIDAIARVATGEADVALTDINALARYRDGDNAVPLKAVFVLFNTAPYAMVARRSRGINALSDIEGKVLGVADGDLSIRFWPAIARLNGIKLDKVRIEKIGAAVREPMLSAGQVDAVTGFSYLAPVNMRNRGIPASDLAVFNLSDFGSEAYGAALIVNPAFATANPAAVKGLVRATIAGLKLAGSDPGKAVDDIISQLDGASPDLERERLRIVLRSNMLTSEVQRNGIGRIDEGRFARAMAQLGEDTRLRKTPTAADIFDPSFLPPSDASGIH